MLPKTHRNYLGKICGLNVIVRSEKVKVSRNHQVGEDQGKGQYIKIQ